jgi:hypothetical protein
MHISRVTRLEKQLRYDDLGDVSSLSSSSIFIIHYLKSHRTVHGEHIPTHSRHYAQPMAVSENVCHRLSVNNK